VRETRGMLVRLRRRFVKGLTINGRLFLLVLAVAIPFSIFLATTALLQARQEREQVRQEMLSLARLTSARLDDHVGDIGQFLGVLAEVVTPESGGNAANDALLRGLASRRPAQINNVAVWSANGELTGSAEQQLRLTGLNVAQRSFFKQAVAGADLPVEAPILAASNGEQVAVFATAVRRQGRVVGVVTATARLRLLQALVLPAGGLPPGAVITVLDHDGVILARSLDPARWIGKNLGAGFVASTVAANLVDGVRDGPNADGVSRIGGFTASRRVPWFVYVGIPNEIALAPMKRHLAQTFLAGLAMLLLGLTAAAVAGRRISAPLRQLSDDAARLEQGRFDHRSSVSQGGEIGQLASALNRMSDSLQERTALLEASRFQLQQITDNLPAMISYLDAQQRFLFANNVFKELLGVDTHALIGKSLVEVYGEAEYAIFRKDIEACLGGRRIAYEREIQTLAGPRRAEVTLIPHRDADHTVVGLFALTLDVTASREATALRARIEERLSLALEGSGSALFDLDVKRSRIYQSAQAATMRGEPALEETTSLAVYMNRVHPDDRDWLTHCFEAALKGRTATFDAEFRMATRALTWIWIRGLGRVVERDAQGMAIRLAGTGADITPRKAAEERLRYLAENDALTGLPNRALFDERLKGLLLSRAAPHRTSALMFLDIDYFKSVNDTFGHEAGDKLLVAFAAILKECVRPSDTVARLAGDEFTIILNDISGVSEATAVAQRIVERVRKLRGFSDAQDGGSGVSTSIGIAFRGPHDNDAAVLLRRADAALYQAKRNGRDSFVCDTTHADDAIEAISDEVTVNAAEAADAAEGSGGLGRARRDR
jgi:diguanylate cyclase (GGDEF)-like protein/PAS domain S-box-containing protein